MVYRNKITGLEFISNCIISAPNYEVVDNITPHKVAPPVEVPEGATKKEDKPKKRTRRVKK